MYGKRTICLQLKQYHRFTQPFGKTNQNDCASTRNVCCLPRHLNMVKHRWNIWPFDIFTSRGHVHGMTNVLYVELCHSNTVKIVIEQFCHACRCRYISKWSNIWPKNRSRPSIRHDQSVLEGWNLSCKNFQNARSIFCRPTEICKTACTLFFEGAKFTSVTSINNIKDK